MKVEMNQEFHQFLQKHATALSAPVHNATLHLEIVWDFLAYILELNYLCLYETEEYIHFHPTYEVARGLQKQILPEPELQEMMRSAHALRQPKSMQIETALAGERYFVQAYAAIPLLVAKRRQVAVICKQLELPAEEVRQGYVFNSYELERHMAVIKNFVRVPEQQMQIADDRKKLNLSKLAVAAGGVFALLEGLSSIISMIKESSFFEVAEGMGAIILLIFLGGVIVRLLRTDEPMGLL